MVCRYFGIGERHPLRILTPIKSVSSQKRKLFDKENFSPSFAVTVKSLSKFLICSSNVSAMAKKSSAKYSKNSKWL